MDTYLHKTMAVFMPSEARLKFLKKMIILGPKTDFVLEGGPGPPGPPLDPPLSINMDVRYPSSFSYQHSLR